MRRIRLTALSAALALIVVACSRDQVENPVEISELDSLAAAESFQENVGSQLDLYELSSRASSALVREQPGQSGVEIVYAFRNQGGMAAVEPLMMQLAEKWPASDDRGCWLPWDRLLDPQTGRPGPFMGAYRAPQFLLTLWIDHLGRDLFVCYQTPAPTEPAASTQAPDSLTE